VTRYRLVIEFDLDGEVGPDTADWLATYAAVQVAEPDEVLGAVTTANVVTRVEQVPPI
jgi:hypothetical protein